MNDSTGDPPRWSTRRWVLTTGLVVIVHLGALVFFGERSREPIRAEPIQHRVAMLTDSSSAQDLLRNPMLIDPVLFARPHLENFSGQAWLRFTPLRNSASNWSETPRWLEIDSTTFGMEFSKHLASNPPPVWLTADLPKPPPLDLRTNAAPRPDSTLELRGELAQWKLISETTLPAWTNTDVLGATEIQLLVSPAGHVFSASLQRSSGFQPADDFALEYARQLRFGRDRRTPHLIPPPDENPAASGTARFRWLTRAPAQTNLVSAVSP